MLLYDDDARLRRNLAAVTTLNRQLAEDQVRAPDGAAAHATDAEHPVRHVVLMSSRDLYDESDCDLDADPDLDLLATLHDALERDCEALSDALAACWERVPEDAEFVSEEVEQAVLTVRTSDGMPRYSGFISLWRFTGHWLGIGVRHLGAHPPVELVALSGPLDLLATVAGEDHH